MEYKDYYKTLGVARKAGADEIKRAYRKLARKYHPDVSKEPNAEDRFKEVNEAYEVLRDPEKRQAYDQLGMNWKAGQDFRPPPGWDGGFEFRQGFGRGDGAGFSDFFESLFGAGSPFTQGRSAGGRFRVAGEDQESPIRLSLEEAYHGLTRNIELQSREMGADGHMYVRPRRMQVRIPAGATEGRRIRLAGKGPAGIGGGPPGDLYLVVKLQPHTFFRPDGRDIHLDLPITPWEAALGEKVEVPTLGGKVEISIPAGSQSGKTVRLRGRGLPGSPPGDQYVHLQVMVPKAETDAMREIYRSMKAAAPFNPRARLGVH